MSNANLLLIPLLALLSYCRPSEIHEKARSNQDSIISIELVNIVLTVNSYEIDTSWWHYPRQALFCFWVTNKCDDTIIFAANECRFSTDHYTYGTFRTYDSTHTYVIGCNKIRPVLPDSSIMIIAYSIDLPVFKRVFPKKEFFRFFHALANNYQFLYQVTPLYPSILKRFKLYKVQPLPTETTITLSPDFCFIVEGEQDQKLQLEDLGYPFDMVPDTIELPHPIPGIEY